MTITSLARRAFTVTCFLLYCFSGWAQQQLPALGSVSNEDLKLKECVFDKSAEAVILFDNGVSFFNEDFNLITERRIRFKILKEKGIDRGNIRIPFYSADDFETIRGIDAVVITPEDNGNVSIKELDRKNIFFKKVNRLYSEVTFALPNVKVGSIIDYKYQSNMKSYAGLDNWAFQSELPVLTSSYELAPIANSEFAYTVYKKSEYPVSIKQDKIGGRIQFEMHNVPGLRDEVYASTTRSYLQRVNFQFASYKDYYGKRNYTNTWADLARELLDAGTFGSQVNKNLSSTPFVKSLSPALTQQEKLKAIYDFVRTNVVWDEIYSKYSEQGVKSVLEKKKGNSADINLLMISLMKSAGLEAYPLLVCERHYGKVDTSYSFLDQFNKVVAYAIVDNKPYVLDGTASGTPYFLVPRSLLNTKGFLVDKKKYGFVSFKDLPHKQREAFFIKASIKDDGHVEGEATLTNGEYAKIRNEQQYKADKNRYLETLLKPHTFIKMDSFTVDGIGKDSMAMVNQLKFHYELKKAGGYHLLTTNLFTGFNENPFITEHRFTDIDFGTKYQGTLIGNFTLPASFIPENLPANKALVSPDQSLSVRRIMEFKDQQLSVRVEIAINNESYLSADYEMIKEFYKQMIGLLNEPVLLKTK